MSLKDKIASILFGPKSEEAPLEEPIVQQEPLEQAAVEE